MRELGSRGGSRGWNQEHSGKDLLSKEIGCFFSSSCRERQVHLWKQR